MLKNKTQKLRNGYLTAGQEIFIKTTFLPYILIHA